MLTRREKRAVIIAAVIAVTFAVASWLAPSKLAFDQFLNDWELVYLFVVVGPLGFYVALDPEAKQREDK